MGSNKEAMVGYFNVYGLSSLFVIVLMDKDTDEAMVFCRTFVAKEAAEKVADKVNLELKNGVHPTAAYIMSVVEA